VFFYSSRSSSSALTRRVCNSLAGTLAGLIGLTGLLALLAPASAQAAAVAKCESQTLSEPFLKWGDTSSYSLAPGGDFEGQSSAWTLSGGAQRVSGSEPYAVTGTLGSSSLSLPAGAQAQSPFTCVEPNDRTFRLFARSEGAEASVRVSVVFQTTLGNIALPVGKLSARESWEPTSTFHTGVLLGALLTEGSVHVALRFTALSGKARIDDVFIDPRMRR
jgi:hypothetical protein